MTDRYFDFDEALDAVEQTPVKVKMFGRKWSIPPEGDALTIIKLQRVMATMDEFEREARENPDRELSDEDRRRFQDTIDFNWDEALRKLVGDDIADQWYATGKLKVTGLVQVLLMLVAVYGGSSKEDVQRIGAMFAQAVGEAMAPSQNGAKPRAKQTKARTTTSSSSRSSKRTSSASTK